MDSSSRGDFVTGPNQAVRQAGQQSVSQADNVLCQCPYQCMESHPSGAPATTSSFQCR
jgi:hypothetical protein